MTYYPINEDTAKRANDANSFRDYKPGSATAAYRAEVDKAAALVEKQKAKVDPMHHDKLDGLLDRYAHRLADYYNDYYRNEAACPSILITGGANFPVAKKEKQNARRDTLAHEYADIQGLLRKIESVGMGGISADDPNAIEKLEEKLARLERTQQTMKDINAYYRKHGTLDGCTLASEEVIRKIKADMKSSWRFSDKPFESYTLSNQNAEIRRLRGRIEELRKQKTEPPPAGERRCSEQIGDHSAAKAAQNQRGWKLRACNHAGPFVCPEAERACCRWHLRPRFLEKTVGCG